MLAVSLRRARTLVRAAAVALVAGLLALAVPVSRLVTITVVRTCCCPDPASCHCPDHDPPGDGHAELRACHREQHASVSADPPAFAIAIALPEIPSGRAFEATFSLPAPHDEPAPPRPAAPS
jgi:hypothetical protein